ncbi:MAG: DUF1002 domain-containing protein [Clostridia bacterium]|nr:DUF1002 domain-containing protein [Clostridia bacterium]
MKKITAMILAVIMTLGVCSAAFALEAGESRLVLGADLTEAQRREAIEYFGITDEDVEILTVTNKDERQYFEGKLPDNKLGRVALSSIYIVAEKEGSGLKIETYNINFVTADMYRNALISAGITDATIKIWAPYALSGTAALTGIYKAYEDMTGRLLDDYAKDLGIEELIATGKLAEYIGSEEALSIINDVKKILDETRNMNDADVLEKINSIAEDYDAELTEDQAKQILRLCRMFEGLSAEEIQQRLVNMAKAAQTANSFKETVKSVIQSIGDFIRIIGDFFADVWNRWFGGDSAEG